MKRKKDKKPKSQRGANRSDDSGTLQKLRHLKIKAFDFKGNMDPFTPGLMDKYTDEDRIKLAASNPQVIIHGWKFIMTSGNGEYQLSASLYPRGRGSTEKDWAFIGAAIKTLGAPMEPTIGDWSKDPNGVAHFMWSKPDQPPE